MAEPTQSAAALLCSQAAACSDPAYTTPTEPLVTRGMCGWNNSIAYRGDDQNTEFDALQVNMAQAMRTA